MTVLGIFGHIVLLYFLYEYFGNWDRLRLDLFLIVQVLFFQLDVDLKVSTSLYDSEALFARSVSCATGASMHCFINELHEMHGKSIRHTQAF